MKKNLLKFFLFVGICGLFLSSCSENADDKITSDNQVTSEVKVNEIPDDTYISNGNITIEQTYENNKLIKLIVNGKVVDPKVYPAQAHYFDGTDAENEACALKKVAELDEYGYKCIYAYSTTGISTNKTVWVVDYSNDDPCPYE